MKYLKKQTWSIVVSLLVQGSHLEPTVQDAGKVKTRKKINKQ